jgi:hypothetical protein
VVKKESVSDARAAGRTAATRKSTRTTSRGPRTAKVDDRGRPKIEGGDPLPTGHLSNRALSGRRYRAYGLRQLAP